MTGTPRLHVPRPPARPGEPVDFSYLKLSPAGALPRPDIDVPPAGTAQLVEGLVRVLDDEHRAVGPWNPGLEPRSLLNALRLMVLTRVFDDRMLRAQRQGRISFYIQSTGEEAIAVAPTLALRPTDMLFPSYRMQGTYIARGLGLLEMMCQLLSNTGDMCKGRQLPTFYHSAALRLFSISGNLATQLPQAVGWAMAAAIKGEEHIAAGWLGEGSSAEADFHHALLFAVVYRAPVVLNVVNNQWGISAFQAIAGGERSSFAARGPGYGMPGLRVDGNDFLAVYSALAWAAERARRGGGPTLIEYVTYRAAAHSTSDDPDRYRPKNEYAHWPLGDPIERLKNHLITLGAWSESRHAHLVAECEEQVALTWKEAIALGSLSDGPRLDPSLLFEDVFKELPAHLRRQHEQLQRELQG